MTKTEKAKADYAHIAELAKTMTQEEIVKKTGFSLSKVQMAFSIHKCRKDVKRYANQSATVQKKKKKEDRHSSVFQSSGKATLDPALMTFLAFQDV